MSKSGLRWDEKQYADHRARGSALTPAQRRQAPLLTDKVDTVPPWPKPTPKPVADAAPKAEGWPVFEAMLRAHRLPAPCYEFRFNAARKWRFDMAFPQHRIAIEVDGGVWSGGRHTRGQGFINDLEKMNAAVCGGWRVLRYTPDTLPRAVDDLKLCIEGLSL